MPCGLYQAGLPFIGDRSDPRLKRLLVAVWEERLNYAGLARFVLARAWSSNTPMAVRPARI